MCKPTVFISYHEADAEWEKWLRTHLGVLEQAGRITLWDNTQIKPADDSYREMKQAVERAAVAVCLISSDYLNSDFCVKEEISYVLEQRKSGGMELIPILLRPCAYKAFPWLKKLQMLPRDGAVSTLYKDNEDEFFAEIADCVLEIVDDLDYVPPEASPLWEKLPTNCVYIERLPKTGTQIFGRAEQLTRLDDVWESGEGNILSFVAWGGVGKSALVNKWVAEMDADNFRGAQRVYAWSFYSQGSGERVTSADLFIDHALRWFGDRGMADSNRSPWDKGQRLAELIQKERTLLLLDGLEPLQSAADFDHGQVKDPALGMVLEELAKENPGLCVITSRQELTDDYLESIEQQDLEQIRPEAGRALLRTMGIRGTDEELEQITRDFGKHALAMDLLIPYLQEIPGRHVRNASLIPDLDIPAEEGKHPRRVMEVWAKHFGEGPELDVLHIMGLFDRPATAEELKYLRGAKSPGLTDHLRWQTDKQWESVIERLRQKRLIALESHHSLGSLDAHPLVREHFGQRLKEANEEAWKQGHYHLYTYLSMSTVRFPNTIEQMTPLFAAVAHGCQAGRHQEVLEEVYYRRISRLDEGFIVRKLGAYGVDLSALSGFFDLPWSQPVAGLIGDHKAFVLNSAGYALRALGRLTEAVQSIEASLEFCIAQEDWENAARAANNLGELHLTIGHISQALDYAWQSLELDDRSGNILQGIFMRTALACALRQSGDLPGAEVRFSEAEAMQKAVQPYYHLLYGIGGSEYCDLLLSQGKYQEVQSRAGQALKWAKQANGVSLLDIALTRLSLGRAHLLQAQEETGDFTHAAEELQKAADGLRQAGRQDYLPRGLLARAELNRVRDDYDRAKRDLEKAMSIATRGGMGLHEADCHLEYARLHLAMGEKDRAREELDKAKEMIDEMGYHRRDGDVEELEGELR